MTAATLARSVDRWCVITETGNRQILTYAGYAPVSVWEGAALVSVRYRHRPDASPCTDACTTYPLTPAQDLAARFPDVRVSLETNGAGFLILSALIVPKGERNNGTGSAVMDALTTYADAYGLPLATTPSADFGGSVARLRRFYARFGFAPNKGRSRDYGTQETMIRRPQH